MTGEMSATIVPVIIAGAWATPAVTARTCLPGKRGTGQA